MRLNDALQLVLQRTVAAIGIGAVWMLGVTIAIVASLETLLCV